MSLEYVWKDLIDTKFNIGSRYGLVPDSVKS